MNAKDMGLDMNEWADLIDEAKKRGALGDMSVIAYRMLGVIITLRHNAILTSAMHSDGKGSAALEKSSIPGDEETFNNGHGW